MLISARASATRCAWPPEIWVGLRRLEAGQLDEAEHVGDAALDLGILDALAAQPEGDVLVDRQVREERVVLEDRVDVALVGRQPGHVLALELDDARRRRLEAADHPEGGRLAAAGRAEQAEELPRADLEVDVVDDDRIAELLDHIDEFDVDGRHVRTTPVTGRGRTFARTGPGEDMGGEDGVSTTRPSIAVPGNACEIRRVRPTAATESAIAGRIGSHGPRSRASARYDIDASTVRTRGSLDPVRDHHRCSA